METIECFSGWVVLGASGPVKIFSTIGGLIGLLIVAWIVIAIAKNKAKGMMSDEIAQSFVLSDLRKMHAAGHLTNEEFERSKTAMFGGRGSGERGGVLSDVDSIKMRGGSGPISNAGDGEGFELGEELLPKPKKPNVSPARPNKDEYRC